MIRHPRRALVAPLALLLLALTAVLRAQELPRIAVADFAGPDAQIRETIARALALDLGRSEALEVVDRAELTAAAGELGVTPDDLADPARAAELGAKVRADVVLTGTFSAAEDRVTISARTVDVFGARVLAGVGGCGLGEVTGRASDAAGLAHQIATGLHRSLTGEWLPAITLADLERMDPVQAEIARQMDPTLALHNPRAGIRLTLEPDKGEGATYAFGEPLTLTVTADAQCSVVLYDVGPDRKMTLLLPNPWHADNRLAAGQALVVPDPEEGWKLRIEGRGGEDTLVAIATKAGFAPPEGGGCADVVNNALLPALAQQPQEAWASATVRIRSEHPAAQALGRFVYVPITPPLSRGLQEAVSKTLQPPDTPLADGVAAYDAGWCHRAAELFATAVRLTPDSADAHYGLAKARYDLGQFEEAEAEFAEAARLGADDALYGVALARLVLGRTDGAVDALNEYLGKAPTGELAGPAQDLLAGLTFQVEAEPSVPGSEAPGEISPIHLEDQGTGGGAPTGEGPRP
jgi:TolB-like protein